MLFLRNKIIPFIPCFHLSPKILKRQWTLLKLLRCLKERMILTPRILSQFKKEFTQDTNTLGYVSYHFTHDDLWLQLEYTSLPTSSYFKMNSYLLIFG